MAWFVSMQQHQVDTILEEKQAVGPNYLQEATISPGVCLLHDCKGEEVAGHFPLFAPGHHDLEIPKSTCFLPVPVLCARVHTCWSVPLRHWCVMRALEKGNERCSGL